MKTLFAFLILASAMLMAQTPFDGVWIAKTEKAELPQKPQIFLLQNGVYECSTCVPKIKVDADGKDHPVAGSPYFSTINIRVIDDHSIEVTEKQREVVVYSETDKVSDKGSSLTADVMDAAGFNGDPIKAQQIYSRVAAAPTGASAISGSWQVQKVTINSENGVMVTYRSIPNGLKASTPDGEGYEAKFDGKDYVIQGDPTRGAVCLTRINDHTIEEADKLAGVVHFRVRMTVSPDGNSMKVVENDLERGTETTYVMEKKQ
ncbi:MAG TPA: hypothetical protein VF753_20370 [Terriglobales bacterium]